MTEDVTKAVTADSAAGERKNRTPGRGRWVKSGTVALVLAAVAMLAGGCVEQGPFYDDPDPLGYGYYDYPGYSDPYYDYYDGPYVAGGAFLYGGRDYYYPYYSHRHRDGGRGGGGNPSRNTGGTVSRGDVPWNSPRVSQSGGSSGSRSSSSSRSGGSRSSGSSSGGSGGSGHRR